MDGGAAVTTAKRTRVVGMRLTPQEYNTLLGVAEFDGVSVPELLRQLWFAELKRRELGIRL